MVCFFMQDTQRVGLIWDSDHYYISIMSFLMFVLMASLKVGVQVSMTFALHLTIFGFCPYNKMQMNMQQN